MVARHALAVSGLMAAACSEFTVTEQDDPPLAEPPGEVEDDDFGTAPDWNDCPHGFVGSYYNLPNDHPDLEPDPDADVLIDDPDLLDWWDDGWLAFQRFDASLDQGSGWWPVDEGLADDPAYFSARWTAWMRVNEALPIELVLGASTDAFVFVNGEVVASRVAAESAEVRIETIDLPTGQFPLEVRFAHRGGDSGLRMRFASEHVAVCYPEFGDE